MLYTTWHQLGINCISFSMGNVPSADGDAEALPAPQVAPEFQHTQVLP